MKFELPVGWSIKTLAECCTETISYGIVQPGKHDENGIPVVRVNNFSHNSLHLEDVLKVSPDVSSKYKRTVLRGGEVLLTLVGSTGKSAVVPDSMKGWNVPRAIAVIRVAPDVGADWINICLQSPLTKHFLDSRANTTVQKTLNLKDVKDIPILLPPQSYKSTALEILNSLTKKLTLNTQTNQTLEAMAQAIFKSWFVDFDPVKAKMQGKQPEGMDADTAALFPDKLVESELGLIPEGWEVKPLDKIAHFQNGLALQKFRPESDDDDFLPVLKIAQLRQGYCDEKEKARTDIKESCKVYDGDMIFSWSGSLMIDLWTGGNAALNQHLFKVTSADYSLPLYLFWTKHHLAQFQQIAKDKAVTMGHIKRGHLSGSLCVVPPKELRGKMDEVLLPLIDKSLTQRLQSNQLTKLRDTLLPKLLSGELPLEQAEKLAEVS